MPEYKNSRIYQIVSPSNPEIPPYYGATVRSLSQRMVQHRSKSNTTSSKLLIDCGDAVIILVEEINCNSKEELNQKEAWYILNNDCINKCIPLRTHKEYYQQNKEKILEYFKKRYNENKEKILEYHKKYYDENKDQVKIKVKKYNEENKNDKKEYDKIYREEHKETKKEADNKYYQKNKEENLRKIICECGGSYNKMSKNKHEQTQKHQKFFM